MTTVILSAPARARLCPFTSADDALRVIDSLSSVELEKLLPNLVARLIGEGIIRRPVCTGTGSPQSVGIADSVACLEQTVDSAFAARRELRRANLTIECLREEVDRWTSRYGGFEPNQKDRHAMFTRLTRLRENEPGVKWPKHFNQLQNEFPEAMAGLTKYEALRSVWWRWKQRQAAMLAACCRHSANVA
jgi:hypothetical protein